MVDISHIFRRFIQFVTILQFSIAIFNKMWYNMIGCLDNLYYFLLCSLLECADKVANTASVYGALLEFADFSHT